MGQWGRNSRSGARQKMPMSFGLVMASPVTAIFIPDRFHSDALQLILGIQDFCSFGALKIVSGFR